MNLKARNVATAFIGGSTEIWNFAPLAATAAISQGKVCQ